MLIATSQLSPSTTGTAGACSSGFSLSQRAEDRAACRIGRSVAVSISAPVTPSSPASWLAVLVAISVLVSCAGARPHSAPLPRAALVHFLAGTVALHREEPALAVAELRAAAAASPDDPELAVALVLALAAQQRAAAAESSAGALAPDPPELTAALARWPRHAALWHAAGELRLARADLPGAERASSRLAAREPSFEPAA
ncbi:MAG: hypothetical protein IPI49_31035, partial [Myxococcales bacterium]|nr:hypothetical protein [Myxococcales bacterium]